MTKIIRRPLQMNWLSHPKISYRFKKLEPSYCLKKSEFKKKIFIPIAYGFWNVHPQGAWRTPPAQGLHVLLPPRDFSMKGAWAGSRIFLLYVLVTRSTSGCFRVISSINVCWTHNKSWEFSWTKMEIGNFLLKGLSLLQMDHWRCLHTWPHSFRETRWVRHFISAGDVKE